MIWGWVLVILPTAFFGWKAVKSRDSLGYFVVWFYTYPLYVLTALSGDYAIPDMRVSVDIANILRVGVHILFFFTALSIGFFFNTSQNRNTTNTRMGRPDNTWNADQYDGE
jgi:hypothetical protein